MHMLTYVGLLGIVRAMNMCVHFECVWTFLHVRVHEHGENVQRRDPVCHVTV